MPNSMTGFARKVYTAEGISFTAEVRTLNHKYLDIHCRLPDIFSAQEMAVRQMVKRNIRRGRVDIRIQIEHGCPLTNFELNVPVYSQYSKMIATIAEDHEVQAVDAVALLSLPNVVQARPLSQDSAGFVSHLEELLNKLTADREREGRQLWADISAQIEKIQTYVGELNSLVPQQQADVEQRFRQRLANFDELDESRLLAEVAVLMERSDINEELVRLQAHIDEFRHTGRQEGSIGRRLEFLGQEMLREINTIAAKSAIYDVSRLAVDIKTELEKVREQIQNIE